MAKRVGSWYGYVYLLRCGEHYKIGFSEQPRKRLQQLRTGSPHPIVLEHELKTTFFKSIEQQLHRRFAHKRGEGEWFNLNDEDVAYIKSLDKHGDTPEEVRQQAEEDDLYWARRDAEKQAETDRYIGCLMSGITSGVGLGLAYDDAA